MISSATNASLFKKHVDERVEQPPTCLYKYRSLEQFEAITDQLAVWYSSPNTFNDKLDCQWDIFWSLGDAYAENVERVIFLQLLTASTEYGLDRHPDMLAFIKQVRAELRSLSPADKILHMHKISSRLRDRGPHRNALQQFNDLVARMRVFCMTSLGEDDVMLSHYASGRTGVVVGFSTDVLERVWAVPAMKTLYEPELPMLFDPWIWYQHLYYHRPMQFEDPTMRFARTKGKRWEYEQEWRFITVGIRRGTGDLMSVPSDAVVSVAFGDQTSSTDMHKYIAKSRSVFQRAKFYKLAPNPRGFGLIRDAIIQ